MKSITREVIIVGSLMAAGAIVRSGLEWAWEAHTRQPAPKNPAAKGVTWSQALLWGGSLGVATGVVRTVLRRSYASMPRMRGAALEARDA